VVSFLQKFIASRNHRKYWSAAAVIGSAIFSLNGMMAQPADENLPPSNPLPDQGPIRKESKAGRGGPLKGYIVSIRIWKNVDHFRLCVGLAPKLLWMSLMGEV
jgi:hypothetical protein